MSELYRTAVKNANEHTCNNIYNKKILDYVKQKVLNESLQGKYSCFILLTEITYILNSNQLTAMLQNDKDFKGFEIVNSYKSIQLIWKNDVTDP